MENPTIEEIGKEIVRQLVRLNESIASIDENLEALKDIKIAE
jgi:hypothetical protein